MKGIKSISVLNKEIQSKDKVWLLLYKSGSSQSDCAIENYKNAALIEKDYVLLYADVNDVRDIHPEYGITTVPALIQFKNGHLKNIVKGCHTVEQLTAFFENSVFSVSAEDSNIPQKNVTVYTSPTCTWCTTIKRHLQEKGVKYNEIDVSRDSKAAEEMVRMSGQQGVPQTNINGQMIVGFDKTKINQLLGIN